MGAREACKACEMSRKLHCLNTSHVCAELSAPSRSPMCWPQATAHRSQNSRHGAHMQNSLAEDAAAAPKAETCLLMILDSNAAASVARPGALSVEREQAAISPKSGQRPSYPLLCRIPFQVHVQLLTRRPNIYYAERSRFQVQHSVDIQYSVM